MAITLLARREQFHQVRLGSHLVASSTIYQDTVRRAVQYFASAGASIPDARHEAIAWLGQQLQMQVALLSYIDVFWVFAIAAAVMVPIALILLRSIRLGSAAPAG